MPAPQTYPPPAGHAAAPAPPVRRRLPHWSDIAPLLNPRLPEVNPTRRRLGRAYTLADLRTIARQRTPRSVFDYVDGAAEEEVSLRKARNAFLALEFRPRVLRDVSEVTTGRRILGTASALPLVLAPTGFTRMMHHAGESAVVRAAARAGVPYTLSTMGTTSIEEVTAAAPEARRWFQLYLWRDRAASRDLIERARAAGYDTLVLTVDTPVAGSRLRDVRNGMTVPPMLGVRTLADMARHPAWWINLLATGPLEFASLRNWKGTVADLVNHMFHPSVTMDDLDWLRSQWDGKLVVKGIQHVDDARAVVDAGADGIVVSHHGGRQLDQAPLPLTLLPACVAAVGDEAEVFLDSGVLRGSDVVAAVALGATAVLVGRAYLYGLMAGGERGVDRALEILAAETRRSLCLLGAPSPDHLVPAHVSLGPRHHLRCGTHQ
ncbi:alpha-hydroxy acid oxidase [Streptomyces sp. NBC_01264]|uniref:alpha-hydroxy acid oxidase n=1 Tax=Streptomyces sp. NBC_01264 TaxID=2903804 RepID=UPI0022541BFC|nr:alpha-hydroxy acid oxidase [Streptomyces sp. NBC_01264]MCX4776089.1 alpha-hydroxy-acid oxidizing protein [Streptomyces sp. NBC_01264]